MSQRTRANYKSTAAGIYTTNGIGGITGALDNSMHQDFADSVPFILDDAPNQTVKISIATAAILTAYATPIQLVAAPGANKVIMPLAALIRMTYNSVAYATNTNIVLGHDGASAGTVVPIMTTSGFLNQTASQTLFASLPAQSGGYLQIVNSLTNFVNKNFCFSVGTGNPTAGNSGLVVSLIYAILDIS